MLDVCTNTIVRDGEDTIRFCLSSVLPYVKHSIVTVDSRSKDRTYEILLEMQKEYPHLEVRKFEIKNPIVDLPEMRNSQLERVKEPWIWIVDSDEYYPEWVVKKVEFVPDATVYMFQCWAVWNRERAHWSSSRPQIARIFRNDGRRWRGRMGKEILQVENDKIKVLGLRYIHFTHLKKDTWREEMGMYRIADDRYLIPMPLDIIREVAKFYDKK